jgi:hypothetical protein
MKMQLMLDIAEIAFQRLKVSDRALGVESKLVYFLRTFRENRNLEDMSIVFRDHGWGWLWSFLE